MDELFLEKIPEEYHKFFTEGTLYDIIIENVVLEQQKKIDVYEKALEFYANPKSWWKTWIKGVAAIINSEDYGYETGGRIAREALYNTGKLVKE